MKLLIPTLALAGAIAVPVLAQDATTDPAASDPDSMTCAEFTALTPGAQADVVQTLKASLSGMEAANVGTGAAKPNDEPDADADLTDAPDNGDTVAASDSSSATEASSGEGSAIVIGVESAEPPREGVAADVPADTSEQSETAAAGADSPGDARLNQQAAVSDREAEDAFALSHLIGACADDPTMMVTSAMMSFQGGEIGSQ
jgi:hypothetical protein